MRHHGFTLSDQTFIRIRDESVKFGSNGILDKVSKFGYSDYTRVHVRCSSGGGVDMGDGYLNDVVRFLPSRGV